MKDENTLKASVLVSQLPDVVKNQTHSFFGNSVLAVWQLLLSSPILVISGSGRYTPL
jgi:hypothetical protein